VRKFCFIFISLFFIGGCSFKDINSKDEKAVKQYTGIYVVDKKSFDEIKEIETRRYQLAKELGRDKKAYEEIDKKAPQILSNGKKYYAYSNRNANRGNQSKHIDRYEGKILDILGENKDKFKLDIEKKYYYIDDDLFLSPISYEVSRTYETKTLDVGGDEGAGFRMFSRSWSQIVGSSVYDLQNFKDVGRQEKIYAINSIVEFLTEFAACLEYNNSEKVKCSELNVSPKTLHSMGQDLLKFCDISDNDQIAQKCGWDATSSFSTIGKYINKEFYKYTFELATQLCDSGRSHDACLRLNLDYMVGNGVPKDTQKAAQYRQKENKIMKDNDLFNKPFKE